MRRMKYGTKGKRRKVGAYKSLGGIPMIIKNGQIKYAVQVPKEYCWYDYELGSWTDAEEQMRKYATLNTGNGSFIRRHIYETKFAIGEETEDERRKREYREWIEKEMKV